MARSNDLTGRSAVVTGADGGIGLCFCEELASRGCALLMISNRQQPLAEAAAKLGEKYTVEIRSLCVDLTCSGAAVEVVEAASAFTRFPDYLINNAGIFSFRSVTDTSPIVLERFLSLHVGAVTELTRLFAIRFKDRGSGRIMNMSSMSCWMPMPGIALYSATKAYIRVLSRAMYYELKDSGVTVTAACPGGIATDLFGLPDNLKRLAVAIGALDTPERFARKAIDRMLRGKKQYINGLLNRLSILFIGITPTPVRMLVKRRMLDKGIVR